MANTAFIPDKFQPIQSVPAFQSYDEIVAYYRRMETGEIPDDISFGHKTVASRQDILQQLLTMNTAGIVVLDCQSGHKEDDNGTGTDIYWRAFLSCYMRRNDAYKLERRFVSKDFIYFIDKFEDLQQVPAQTIPVTRSENMGNLRLTKFVSINLLYPDLQKIMSNTSKDDELGITKDLVQVHFIDPVWGRTTYLFDELVKELRNMKV